MLTTYDVFDAEGIFDRQVSFLAPGDPRKDDIYRLPDGRLIVVQGAIDAVQREQGAPAGEGARLSDEVSLEVIRYTF